MKTQQLWSILICLSAALAFVPADRAAAQDGPSGQLWVYIGTYTAPMAPKSKGIYVSKLDLKTGQLDQLAQLAAETVSPSFVAIHPNNQYLYAVNEVKELGGKPTGGVSSFQIDPISGMLKFLNQQQSHGADPCHIVVDKTGKNVLVANYTGGSIASLPIGADGMLGAATSAIKHEGSGFIKPRQAEPHAHSINIDSQSKFAMVCDLGLDKVLVYRFDAGKGLLVANDPPSADVTPPGSGPRHFALLPNEKFAYVNNEITKTISAFRFDSTKGTLTAIQEGLSTVPQGVTGGSTAETVAHPSGRFVYTSNRGHDSIAIFAVDAETGKLTAKGHQPTGGQTPRNFAIDPTGTYLLAENQRSDSVVVMRIDPQTGLLTDTGNKLEVPSPVCIRMFPVAK